MAACYPFSGEDHQDLVIEILSRLYVKSLIRCTCVCKSWHTLVKSWYFITKHLNRSRKALLSNDAEEAPLFLICKCNKGLREWMVSYITSTFNNNETEVAALPNSLPFVENFVIPNTMGPVNGIYCWTKKPVPVVECDSLFLCNPALREVQSIPKIPRRSFVEAGEGSYYYLSQAYGFGYDYNTSDYKVVAVTGCNSTSAESHGLQIFVYTLSSNSWRRIPMNIENFPARPFERLPVLTDGYGVCHWLTKDKQQHRVMLSFDFGSEAFKWSPLPQGHGGPNSNKGLCLSVLNESSIMLIVVHDSRMEHKIKKIGCCYEIFRMNEGGSTGEELWTMLYTIEPIPGVRQPLGFRNNGEIILAKFDGSLVTYDPSCEQINLLHICREGFEGYQVCTYMESLVSICRGSRGA